MLYISDNFVCKKEQPYHRNGKAGCKQCQKWDREDFLQMKEYLEGIWEGLHSTTTESSGDLSR